MTSLVDLGLPVTMDDADLALFEAFEDVFGPVDGQSQKNRKAPDGAGRVCGKRGEQAAEHQNPLGGCHGHKRMVWFDASASCND